MNQEYKNGILGKGVFERCTLKLKLIGNILFFMKNVAIHKKKSRISSALIKHKSHKNLHSTHL